MPRPTPAKIMPPTMPRLPGAVCGSTVDAASTMITPPLNPARKRQVKNQRKATGTEQARQDSVASTMVPRSAGTAPVRAAIGRASSAPAR